MHDGRALRQIPFLVTGTLLRGLSRLASANVDRRLASHGGQAVPRLVGICDLVRLLPHASATSRICELVTCDLVRL